MILKIKGEIRIFEHHELIDKVSKEIDRFNKRILKLKPSIDGCISVSNSKEVLEWKWEKTKKKKTNPNTHLEYMHNIV